MASLLAVDFTLFPEEVQDILRSTQFYPYFLRCCPYCPFFLVDKVNQLFPHLILYQIYFIGDVVVSFPAARGAFTGTHHTHTRTQKIIYYAMVLDPLYNLISINKIYHSPPIKFNRPFPRFRYHHNRAILQHGRSILFFHAHSPHQGEAKVNGY